MDRKAIDPDTKLTIGERVKAHFLAVRLRRRWANDPAWRESVMAAAKARVREQLKNAEA